MIYGENLIFNEGVIYSQFEFPFSGVINDWDIIYYVYNDLEISTEKLIWELYKKPTESSNYSIAANGNTENGLVRINLNNLNIQFEDNKFLLKVYLNKTGVLVGESEFWYYYEIYTTKIPKVVPWYSGISYLQYQGGGAGTAGVAVMPVSREKDIPNISIENIEEKDEDFDINILTFIEDKNNKIFDK